jgi:hypothetical protein
MVNQPIAIRKFEKKVQKSELHSGHCQISPFVDGGIIGEMGSIKSRTRARARAAEGGREATLDLIDPLAKLAVMR